jgi:VWFA-related protein
MRPTRTGRAALPLVLVIAIGAVGPLRAQPPGGPVFGVDVQLVAVPVFVVKDGHAVGGLTSADFEVLDQGRVVPLAGFLAVDAGAPATSPEGASRALAAAARRQFLLLFDLTFSNPAGILKAREGALAFLEKGPEAGDLVAVASFGPAGANVLVGFTPDRLQAAHAVATLGSAEALRVRDPLGLAYDLGLALAESTGQWGLLIQSLEKGRKDPADGYRENLLQMARASRDEYRQRVGAYVGEMQRLAQLLDSVQGRKQVILLSGGFDQTVLTGAESTEQAENATAVSEGRLWEVQGDRHFGDSAARSGLENVFAALARTDTVIHTVDVGGLSAGATGALDEMGSETRGSGRETLAQLAGRSGGRFVHDTNDLAGALREVLAASRYYYVLAFEPGPPPKRPGELRKLEIKVKRPGFSVSHRAGYTVAEPGGSAPLRKVQAAEIIAKGLSGGELRLHAAAVPYRRADAVSLPVVLEIDGESLLAGGATQTLALEVYGYAFDGEGRVLDVVAVTPKLDLARVGTLVRERGVQVLTSFRVTEGTADLRFLVRDPVARRAGSLRLATAVPRVAAETLVVSSPLMTDDPRARLVIPAASQNNPNLEIPFRIGETAFTVDAAPVLRGGRGRELCVMAAGPLATPPALTAALVREDGSALALKTTEPRVVRDADGYLRLVVSVAAADAPAAEYRLRVALRDAGGREVRSETPVRVEP